MRFEDIKGTGDLCRFLREYECWVNDGSCYDQGTVAAMLVALIDNMRKNYHTGDMEEFPYRLNDEQRLFLAKLAAFANMKTDAEIEKEDD